MFFQLTLAIAFLGTLALAGNPYTAEVSNSSGWMDKVHLFEKEAELFGSKIKASFLGDAFIQQWQVQGLPIWLEKYQFLPTGNLGINDDRTQNVLWRVENASIANVNPKVVVLMVGGANIVDNDAVTDIAQGIQNILKALARYLPNTAIILNSVLPKDSVEQDTRVQELNQLISQFADNAKVYFLDLTSQFENGLGQPKRQLYGLFDSSRLSVLGYIQWAKALEPLFSQLID